MLAAEHALAYFAFVAALVVVCERGSAMGLLVGTWAAITLVSLYSLATHLGPAVFGVYRDPLAARAAVSADRLLERARDLLRDGDAACARDWPTAGATVALRAIAAASIAPLAATTYFTFSRGSWLALGHRVCLRRGSESAAPALSRDRACRAPPRPRWRWPTRRRFPR